MKLTKRQIKREIDERETLKSRIRAEFGNEAITTARNRLCLYCKYVPCRLLPITSKGEDCPYFTKGGG